MSGQAAKGNTGKTSKWSNSYYRIKFTDRFLDNLYGHIGVTEVERKIERLSLFKRLHSISQLGLTNWIFPCALHTRYDHSLGVMHTAYNMACHINMNCDDFFNDTELQIIRLAGMLHDIGHYPLSHNIEMAYKYGKKDANVTVSQHLKQLIGCPDFLNPDEIKRYPSGGGSVVSPGTDEDEKKFSETFSGSTGFHHEAIGQCIITRNQEIRNIIRNEFVMIKDSDGVTRINRDLKPIKSKRNLTVDEITDELLQTIAAMVIGNYEFALKDERFVFQKKYSAMLQLIHSELDADNLDYLLRDATFSGTSYGIMDINVLMNCLTVSPIEYPDYTVDEAKRKSGAPDEQKRISYLVGVKPKGIGCVEQFYQNKYLAYGQMIFSKYVSILEAMLLVWAMKALPGNKTYGTKSATSTGDNNKKGLQALVESEETEKNYLRFTDAYIMQEIYHENEERQTNETTLSSPLIKAVSSRLMHYEAFELADGVAEELVVGFDSNEIRNKLVNSSLYKEFCEVYDKIKEMKVEEYYFGADSKELFQFRFESYSLTKQKQWNEFCDSVKNATSHSEHITFRKHFYRLADGVPIIRDSSYKYQCENDVDVEKDTLPELVVDYPGSTLHKICGQQFVYLRKYKIEEHNIDN